MDDPVVDALRFVVNILFPLRQKDYTLQPGSKPTDIRPAKTNADEPTAPICGAMIEGKICRKVLGHDAHQHDRLQTPGSRKRKYGGTNRTVEEPEFCGLHTCVKTIEMQAFKGTGYCSGNCAKIAKGEKPAATVPLPPAQVS